MKEVQKAITERMISHIMQWGLTGSLKHSFINTLSKIINHDALVSLSSTQLNR